MFLMGHSLPRRLALELAFVQFDPIVDVTSRRIGVSPTQSKWGRLFDALTVHRYERIGSGR
jgi:hypothetical protein